MERIGDKNETSNESSRLTAFFIPFFSVIQSLRNILQAQSQASNALAMQAYMKDRFAFLGIKAADRRMLAKPILLKIKKEESLNWDFVFDCFEQEEREFQYIACDYLRSSHRKLKAKDIDSLESLLLSKSWWDTVDQLATEVGYLVLKYDLKALMMRWATHDNFWIRRTAIIHQLKFKTQTDTELLAYCIDQNLGSKEFFINKGIGWALRAYGDINPVWVVAFADAHDLAPLSKREALRKIT